MAEASNYREIFIQNLKDAGCSQETINTCINLAINQDTKEIVRILSRHRQYLLDEVHSKQKEIDCLDYLLFNIGRKNILPNY